MLFYRVFVYTALEVLALSPEVFPLFTPLALSLEGSFEGSPEVLPHSLKPFSRHSQLLANRLADSIRAVTFLESTLMKAPVSVANKELTGSLNPLDATLMKNRGGGGVMVNQLPPACSPWRVFPRSNALMEAGSYFLGGLDLSGGVVPSGSSTCQMSLSLCRPNTPT